MNTTFRFAKNRNRCEKLMNLHFGHGLENKSGKELKNIQEVSKENQSPDREGPVDIPGA
jgi:hypothetical protein